MKFSDLQERYQPRPTTTTFEDVDIWDEDGIPSVDLQIEFEIEDDSYSDHPYGEGTAREHHPGSLNIYSVTTTKPAEVIDEDGNVISILPAGTEMMKAPVWTPSDYEYFVNQLVNQFT